MDVLAFAAAHLPAAPARVLEVGCGDGELARGVARGGYDVLAIDPRAPEGDIFEAVSLEALADPGPFDAVIANRSLHHVGDLVGAMDKIARLLQPGGRVLVREHAWDHMDEATARWYLAHRAVTSPDAPRSVEQCTADWRRDHANLHDSVALRRELDRRFVQRFFQWTPYLHEELGGGGVTERDEQARIDAGDIRPTGFLYVGSAGSAVQPATLAAQQLHRVSMNARSAGTGSRPSGRSR
jgi:SAM-dependent methyltransferase